MNRFCKTCNIKIDENKWLKDGTVCKSCYNNNRRINNNTLIQNQQPKIDNNNNNRNLIIGFSNCGKTHLKKYILLQKQEQIILITKSLNQNPNIEAQTSDEIQPLENYENSTIVLMICCYQNRQAPLIYFLQDGVTIKLKFTIFTIFNNIEISQPFSLAKNKIRNNSNINIFLNNLYGTSYYFTTFS